MPEIIMKIGERQKTVPEGHYKAVVLKIEERTRFNKKQLDFTFELKDQNEHGVILKAFLNANYESFTSHTKIYRWLAVANKNDLEEGAVFSEKIFYNKVFLVEVKEKISRKTKNLFCNVTEIVKVLHEI